MSPAASQDLLEATLVPALCLPFEPPAQRSDPVDPLLVSSWPEPQGGYELLWCAAATDVEATLPQLWAELAPQVDPGGAGCVDLVVDVDGRGRLAAIWLESVPLARLLAALGDPDGATTATQSIGLPAEVAGPALADLLERLWLLGAG